MERDDAHKLHVVDLHPISADPEPAFDAMNDVFFMLFTRSNPLVGQRIGFNVMDIINSNFNPANDVRVLIHGWLGSFTVQENPRTTADFLRRADYNVIGKFKNNFLSNRFWLFVFKIFLFPLQT